MAVLSKIRDRSLFLILIIGMALFAFVASPKDIIGFFKSDKANFIGSVNGEDISREEFSERVKSYQSGRSNINDTQANNAVWDNLMKEKIYASQLDQAGIVVGEKDIWERLINDPSIKNSPQFLNEAGLFDEESLKSYIADLQEDTSSGGKERWQNWISYERSIKQNIQQNTYLNLVKSGIGVSVEDGKRNYTINNTNVNGKFVYLAFNKVADSTIQVTDAEIQKYLDTHEKEFQVKASRDIQYVKFDLLASEADKEVIKKQLIDLLEDKEEYNKAAQATLKVVGLKNTTDYVTYVAENSDIPFNDTFLEKESLKGPIADSLFNLQKGEIYGPYEEAGYYKISKMADIKDIPSVKSSHILISYKGAQNAKPEVEKTKEEAETEAKRILKKVSRRGVDFAEEAKLSSDGPSASKGGDLNWSKEGRMVPAFNDWIFSHKKGEIGLVETDFGWHVIKIDDTKSEKGFKLATISKIIVPSEETENRVFVEAESFAADVSKGGEFNKLAKEKKYFIKKAEKMTYRDETVPGLTGNNRSIIYWAFDEGRAIGSVKRFEIDKAYVVAQLVQKESAGLQSVKSATSKVKPILIKDKKAAFLSKKLENGSLDEIATREGVRVQNTGVSSFSNPSTHVLGKDKAVLGALLSMKEGEVVRGVRGQMGVFALELIKKDPPVELSSYEPYRVQLIKSLKKDNNKIYEALKEASSVEDYRQ